MKKYTVEHALAVGDGLLIGYNRVVRLNPNPSGVK